jgi:ABC-type transport system involved in cytochrome c biogenesis permease component
VSDESTLMGRDEQLGRPYPLWLERLLLLGAVIIAFTYASSVAEAVDHPQLGPLVGYLVFPLTLLGFVELVGRAIQAQHGSKL